MTFRLRRRHAIDDELKRVVCEQVDRAAAALGDGSISEERAVHEARQRIKRVRAVLRLVRPHFPAFDVENADYRDIARKLSPARDAAVVLRTFDELARDLPRGISQRAQRRLRDSLVAAPTHDPSGPPGLPERMTDSVHALQWAAQRIPVWSFDAAGDELLFSGLRKTCAQGRARMASVLDEASADAFHEWRKRVKDLRYQLQLLQRCCPEMLRAHVRLLDDLGDLLGKAHDLNALRTALASQGAELVSARAMTRLVQHVEAREHKLWAKARRLGAQAYAEKPGAFSRRIAACWEAWRHAGRGR